MTHAADLAERARIPTVLDQTALAGARAYAQAYLNLAEASGQADAALDELDELINDVREAYPGLARVLFSPIIKPATKERLICHIIEGRGSDLLCRFIKLLNRRGRLNLLREIAHEARRLWNAKQRRYVVQIVTAHPLDDDQRQWIEEVIRSKVAVGSALFQYHTDPSLIGGLVVSFGDHRFDLSIRSKLARIQTRLLDQRNHEIQNRRDHFSYSA